MDGDNLRMVDFKYDRSVTDQYGRSQTRPAKLSVPLISMIPVPFIRIKDMTVDFVFKITTNRVDESGSKKEVKSDISGGWGPVKISAGASYSSEKKHTSSVDKSAELKIIVNAVQDEIPEGLRNVLSIFNNLIKEPPPSESASKAVAAE
jgi:hypothetical protein